MPRLLWIITRLWHHRFTSLHHPGQSHHTLMMPWSAGAYYAPVYSYNCSAPPKPPELLPAALDCHWLDGITLLCC